MRGLFKKSEGYTTVGAVTTDQGAIVGFTLTNSETQQTLCFDFSILSASIMPIDTYQYARLTKTLVNGLAVLSIESEHHSFFSPVNDFSLDFQNALLKNLPLIENKAVLEIGCGCGVNVLHCHRHGATQVIATEISIVYGLLTYWNIQYSQELQQVPPGSLENTNIFLTNTIPELTYQTALFNSPQVLPDKNNIKSSNYDIHHHVFVALLTKAFASTAATQGLWRFCLYANEPQLLPVPRALLERHYGTVYPEILHKLFQDLQQTTLFVREGFYELISTLSKDDLKRPFFMELWLALSQAESQRLTTGVGLKIESELNTPGCLYVLSKI